MLHRPASNNIHRDPKTCVKAACTAWTSPYMQTAPSPRSDLKDERPGHAVLHSKHVKRGRSQTTRAPDNRTQRRSASARSHLDPCKICNCTAATTSPGTATSQDHARFQGCAPPLKKNINVDTITYRDNTALRCIAARNKAKELTKMTCLSQKRTKPNQHHHRQHAAFHQCG